MPEEANNLTTPPADPSNFNHLDNLARLLEREIEPVITTPDQISQGLAKYYGLADTTVETMLSTVSSASTCDV